MQQEWLKKNKISRIFNNEVEAQGEDNKVGIDTHVRKVYSERELDNPDIEIREKIISSR